MVWVHEMLGYLHDCVYWIIMALQVSYIYKHKPLTHTWTHKTNIFFSYHVQWCIRIRDIQDHLYLYLPMPTYIYSPCHDHTSEYIFSHYSSWFTTMLHFYVCLGHKPKSKMYWIQSQFVRRESDTNPRLLWSQLT